MSATDPAEVQRLLDAKREAWAAFTAYTPGADQRALLDEYDLAELAYSSHLTDDTVQAMLDERERLLRQRDTLADALRWCGGSADFAPGGQAHVGWQRIVQPALAGLDTICPEEGSE